MRLRLPSTATRTERWLMRALFTYGVILAVDIVACAADRQWSSVLHLAGTAVGTWLIRHLWVELIVAKTDFRTMQSRYTLALNAADAHRRRVRRVLAVLHTATVGEHATRSRDFGRGVAHMHTLICEALGLQETNPS